MFQENKAISLGLILKQLLEYLIKIKNNFYKKLKKKQTENLKKNKN